MLVERPSAGVIIAGDFNSLNPCLLCHRLNSKRLVRAPTRGNNTLDQILTNMPDLYEDVQHSDHQCLLIKPITKPKDSFSVAKSLSNKTR